MNKNLHINENFKKEDIAENYLGKKRNNHDKFGIICNFKKNLNNFLSKLTLYLTLNLKICFFFQKLKNKKS